ncbi:redox-sensing transcriptional repressor Rex [Kamptonema cortianum]|nr:redox-sensing transcriptional repressor Rex [Kamptonema cortianum]MDL5048026.1 redox-sensing transcriptional repressor Rex [Oscillatoria amoena NRMC-F 0135]MDL5052509.1 redox-sensing transcriptional repressor Rex [Oscillatoria laete-virens NRMC-F 0139]
MNPDVPRKTVYRLSVFFRCLQRLADNDVETVSSGALAKIAGVSSAQLRKDLAYFGNFGLKGVGYNVNDLQKQIARLLGTNKLKPVILVGVGDLGSALLSYRGFQKEGFEIVAGFDSDIRRKRSKKFEIPILPMDRLKGFVTDHGVKMAIMAVPTTVAQDVCNQLVSNGIEGILNFVPIMLEVPDQVVVNNVNLAMELENLSYFIK